MSSITGFCQQNEEHGPHSDAEHDDLANVDKPHLAGQQVPPNIGSDVHEVTSHEDQHVVLGLFVDCANCQPNHNANQRHEVDESIAEHCLYVGKAVFDQNSNVSHFSWDLVRHNGNHNRRDDMHISRGKANADSKAIEEVVNEGREQVQVASRAFAFQVFPAGFFLLNSTATSFVGGFSRNVSRISQNQNIGQAR